MDKAIYEYKGKPYQVLTRSKIKMHGDWWDVVIYKCLYVNPDGILWVRFAEEFEELFKLKEQ